VQRSHQISLKTERGIADAAPSTIRPTAETSLTSKRSNVLARAIETQSR
jgi:hypothetical protein